MFAGHPGDKVVAMALVNPAARLGSPSAVLDVLKRAELHASDLWLCFKGAGGRSKEDAGVVDETEQVEALTRAFERLQQACARTAPPRAPTPAETR